MELEGNFGEGKARQEELSVVEAIFPELQRDNGGVGGRIEVPVEPLLPVNLSTKGKTAGVTRLPPMIMFFSLPGDYPHTSPPKINLQCLWMTKMELNRLTVTLLRMWMKDRDQILYTYIDYLQCQASDAFSIVQPLMLEETVFDDLCRFDETLKHEQFSQSSFRCSICMEKRRGSLCHRLGCGHVACSDCLRNYYTMCIEEGFLQQVKCVDLKCPYKIDIQKELDTIVGKELVERFLFLQEKQRLEKSPYLVYCPRQFCQAAVERDPDEKLVQCSKCGHAFCSLCRRTWHGPAEACRTTSSPQTIVQEYLLADDNAKALLEKKYSKKSLQKLVEQVAQEEAVSAYIREHAQLCPQCEVPITKEEGCNHMFCTRCSAHFCFLCGAWLQADNPYRHFSERSSACYGLLFEGMSGVL